MRDFEQINQLTDFTEEKKQQLKDALQRPDSIYRLTIVAAFVGIIHSALGRGPFYNIITLNFKYIYFDIWMTFLIALIWMTITQAGAIFIGSLKLFAGISKQININLLNVEQLTVFLKAGIRSTLAFIGTYALFPLLGYSSFEDMFLNPAVFIFIPIIAAMILIPIIPIRKIIRMAIEEELNLFNRSLKGEKDCLKDSQISHDLHNINIIDLITYKKTIMSIKEIPFNVPIALRFLFYIIIPLLTWIAASLVDKIVVAILKY